MRDPETPWVTCGPPFHDIHVCQGGVHTGVVRVARQRLLPPQCLVNLGGAYRFLGRYDEAIATYEKALKLRPDYMPARVALVVAYALAGREEKARSEASEVMRIDPQFSLDRYAKMYPFRQALVDQVVEALRKAGLK